MREIHKLYIPTYVELMRDPIYVSRFDSKAIGSMYRILVANVWRLDREEAEARGLRGKVFEQLSIEYENGNLVTYFDDKKLAALLGVTDRYVRELRKKLEQLGLIRYTKLGKKAKYFYQVGELLRREEYGTLHEVYYIDKWLWELDKYKKRGIPPRYWFLLETIVYKGKRIDSSENEPAVSNEVIAEFKDSFFVNDSGTTVPPFRNSSSEMTGTTVPARDEGKTPSETAQIDDFSEGVITNIPVTPVIAKPPEHTDHKGNKYTEGSVKNLPAREDGVAEGTGVLEDASALENSYALVEDDGGDVTVLDSSENSAALKEQLRLEGEDGSTVSNTGTYGLDGALETLGPSEESKESSAVLDDKENVAEGNDFHLDEGNDLNGTIGNTDALGKVDATDTVAREQVSRGLIQQVNEDLSVIASNMTQVNLSKRPAPVTKSSQKRIRRSEIYNEVPGQQPLFGTDRKQEALEKLKARIRERKIQLSSAILELIKLHGAEKAKRIFADVLKDQVGVEAVSFINPEYWTITFERYAMYLADKAIEVNPVEFLWNWWVMHSIDTKQPAIRKNVRTTKAILARITQVIDEDIAKLRSIIIKMRAYNRALGKNLYFSRPEHFFNALKVYDSMNVEKELERLEYAEELRKKKKMMREKQIREIENRD